MMHTTASRRPEPVPTPPATEAGGDSDPTLTEQVIAQLYDKKILNAQQVSKASVKLRLRPVALAAALGYDNVSDFYSEFVTNASDAKDAEEERAGWSTWTFDEMTELVKLRYGEGKMPADIVEIMQKKNPARTYKSVTSFLLRTFDHGNRVDKYVWDLLLEGNTAEEIADAGYNHWRVEFADMLMRLRRYCATIPNAPDPVILFRE